MLLQGVKFSSSARGATWWDDSFPFVRTFVTSISLIWTEERVEERAGVMTQWESVQRAAKEKAVEAKRATVQVYTSFRNSEGFYKMRRGWNTAWYHWNETPRLERKTMEATNSEPWGPTGSELAALAGATFDAAGAADVARAVNRRLTPTKANARGTYKALVVTEYVLVHGGERFLAAMRAVFDTFLRLQTYERIRKDGIDDGASVRKKAVIVTELLADEDKLRAAQKKARELRGRFRGFSGDGGPAQQGHIADDTWEGASPLARAPVESSSRRSAGEDSLALVPRVADTDTFGEVGAGCSTYIHSAIVEAPVKLGALKVPDWKRPEVDSPSIPSTHAFHGSHAIGGTNDNGRGDVAGLHSAKEINLLDEACRIEAKGPGDIDNLTTLGQTQGPPPGQPPSYESLDNNPF